MDLISVIVPVYKVEAYLDQCVQSIVDQTYKNLEIILVDDGSPDNCGAMCDAWAQKESRIKVIHQANAGAGAARNHGLRKAHGDLIAFVDSDDYLASNMYAHLYSFIESGADIAECGHIDVTEDNISFPEYSADAVTYTAEEAMRCHIQDTAFRQLIWNKLYRREMVSGVFFPEGKKIDDEFFTYQVLGNASKLIRSCCCCYAYRQQAGSVMHNLDSSKRLQAVDAKVQRHQYVNQHFPVLVADSLVNIWFTCLYQGQCILSQSAAEKGAFAFLQNTLQRLPFDKLPSQLAFKQKVWMQMARISFSLACRARNLLKIGI